MQVIFLSMIIQSVKIFLCVCEYSKKYSDTLLCVNTSLVLNYICMWEATIRPKTKDEVLKKIKFLRIPTIVQILVVSVFR